MNISKTMMPQTDNELDKFVSKWSQNSKIHRFKKN